MIITLDPDVCGRAKMLLNVGVRRFILHYQF